MFHNLRIRLTLFNAAVIAILFSLLTTGTYLYVNSEIKARSYFVMTRMAEDIDSGRTPFKPPPHPQPPPPRDRNSPGLLPPPPAPPPIFFYVKTDPAGQIAYSSDSSPMPPADLQQLTNQVLESGAPRGEINFKQKPFCFILLRNDLSSGFIVVFEDFENQRALLQLLVTGLIGIGVFCMILSLFGSFFMADFAMKPVKNAWQQQKDFIADASHELRTPLAVIQANLDIVRDNPEDSVKNQFKWINNIQDSLTDMTALVNSLLFLARHDARQTTLAKKQFDLSAACLCELETLHPLLHSKRIQWSEHIEPGISVEGDTASLRQVLRILVDNAVNHTPDEGTIKISLLRESSSALLIVENMGDIIAAEHLDKIFDRFYQTDKSRGKGGTGLGLAIAKSIVESHHGTITVTSLPEAGTKFVVSLRCT